MADIRETAKAEAERRYARYEWTNGPGNRPVRFRSRAAEDAFVAGALWAWRARGEADAEAVKVEAPSVPNHAQSYEDAAASEVIDAAAAAIRALDEEDGG